MCSGKTHLVCSAAVVATPVLAMAGNASPPLVNSGQALLQAGLILAGVIGGLFPDLDAPESELLHAPRKLAGGAVRATTAALGLRRNSLVGIFVWGFFTLPGALLGGLVTGLSLAIRSVSHHRGLTHELRGLALFTGLVLLLTAGVATGCRFPPTLVISTTLLIGVVWLLGYLTHLLLDALTIAGIPLLSERRMLHLLPRGQRIRTGTWPDTLLLRGAALVWLVVLAGIAFIP